MRNKFKSLVVKITALILVSAFVGLLTLGISIMVFYKLKDDGNAINISGSERMRTMLLGYAAQRYLEEIIENKGIENDNAIRLKEVINREISTYQLYLDALRLGSRELGLGTQTDEEILDSMKKIQLLWKPFRKGIETAIDSGTKPAEKGAMRESFGFWNAIELIRAVDRTVTLLNEQSNQKIAYALALDSVLFVVLAALFLWSMVVIRRMIRPLRDVSLIMEDIAGGGGNLTARLDIASDEELRRMSEAFNTFVERIRGVISEVARVAVQLAASSEMLSVETTALSGNAQRQAATAEEITLSVEEMSGGMDDIARNAKLQFDSMSSLLAKIEELSNIVTEMSNEVNESLKLTTRITERARIGEESLRKMKLSMEKITESSTGMVNIIKIINDISGKINLLSLNAAIEAARAGEQGRGFAVVADEISKLADQTTSSVKEIDELIKVNDTETGAGLLNINEAILNIGVIIDGVNSINVVMNKISDFMQKQLETNTVVNQETGKVNEISEKIRFSTAEEKISSSEIAESITSINELTQSNASGTEKIADNAAEIARTADSLKNLVEYFKV